MKTPSTNCYILWADDDQDDLDMLHDILNELDYPCNIIEVHNGRKVLDHLAAIESPLDFPCLIVLDINMPVLDGRVTLRALKEDPKYSKLPVIMFSTSSSSMDEAYCRKYGVDMITKPPTLQKFKAVVAQILNLCDHSQQQVI